MAAPPLTLGGCSLVAGYFARLSEESTRQAARLRRRFPSTEGPATVLQIETVRDSSKAQPAAVDTVVRAYDSHGSLQSIIRSAVAADLQQRDGKASIDGLLASLDARLDTLLFRK